MAARKTTAAAKTEAKTKAGKQLSVKRPVGRPRADGKPPVQRQEIFMTATRLIAQHGYTGTSLRMIAEELGIKAPSIIQLFNTKDRLLIELVTFLTQFSLAFHHALDAEAMPPDVRLYKMIFEETRAVSGANRDAISVYYLPELRQPQFKEAQQQRALMIAQYQRQIEAGVSQKLFRDVNVAATAERVFQLTETGIIALDPQSLGSPAEQGRSTAEFVLQSLLVKPARRDAIARKAMASTITMGP